MQQKYIFINLTPLTAEDQMHIAHLNKKNNFRALTYV